MSYSFGLIRGHWITLRRFLITFWHDIKAGRGLHRRGGGDLIVDLWKRKPRSERPTVLQDSKTEGLFTVEYPDERLPVYERFRVLPMLIYDDEDGNVRCTCCNICAKVCPPQCIWMTHAHGHDGKPVPLPEDFFIDMDVCMNCGLCSEYCPFDAIKMDHNFELSNYERHQTHIFSLQDLLVSSDFYARTHPDAWASEDEVVERGKVAKKKAQRLTKALSAAPKPAPAAKPVPKPVTA
jgi:NADH-quinone oxidoreductase subunit I